jgi:hypothetical protein
MVGRAWHTCDMSIEILRVQSLVDKSKLYTRNRVSLGQYTYLAVRFELRRPVFEDWKHQKFDTLETNCVVPNSDLWVEPAFNRFSRCRNAYYVVTFLCLTW